MVAVPPGTFLMGSPASDASRNANESPQRRITIQRAFAVGKYPVTRRQFAAFVQATGFARGNDCMTDRASHGVWDLDPDANWRDPAYPQGDDHPAACISWDDAQAYVRWLNTQVRAQATMVSTGGSDGPYRLLSEAEYEYAARAGATTPYPWGASADQGCPFANGADASAHASYPRFVVMGCSDGAVYTARVGSYRANAFHLYDMIGNVWEWVEDCFSDTLANIPDDGGAYESSACPSRAFRGGSWNSPPSNLRSAQRHQAPPSQRSNILGFRVARSL
jgi:formylglycine-generating enzyme required for sulfatase activity